MRTAFLAVLLALVPQEVELSRPASHWKLDGDVAPGGKIAGGAAFIDSPIGASGKALALNGVDALAQIDPANGLEAGSGDFSVSLWVCPIQMKDCMFLWRKKGWWMGMFADGRIRFGTGFGEMTSDARQIQIHRWIHIAASVKRGENGRQSALWVNGEKVGSGDVRPGNADPPKDPLVLGWWSSESDRGRAANAEMFFAGLMDDVRLYDKPLEAGDVAKLVDEGLPWARKKERAPFGGSFSLEKDDVVAILGGEDAMAAQDLGHLEAILSSSARGKRVLFRSLAWEGDTVYEQPRLLNFGSWRDQLARAGASVIVAQFGRIEALEGRGALERFSTACDRLLGELAASVPRIVLVSPTPYEKPAQPLRDVSQRNEDLKLFVEAMKKTAEARRLVFVDLFSARLEGPLTRDGIHLTPRGHEIVAREIARQLGIRVSDDLDALRSAIVRKNRLWQEYWRPSNWAFLNGDRIEQPSSRDHVDKRIRWFPVEVQQTLALVRREDAAIEKLLEAKR